MFLLAKKKVKVQAYVKPLKNVKKEKQYNKNPVLVVFVFLYKKPLDMSRKPSNEQKAKAAEDVSQKFIPKDILWYLIYAYRPACYQADHIFEHIIDSKSEKMLQTIFCVINMNTRYAFAEPVDYI